ncbi:TonB-dependent receptor [Thalassotalea sp. LPB0316]|uniref:TonB-dependent receptor n=1 Tax=Thalassotalea sp. LPB0316 TaxID=2769490 RepID=UPI001868D51D|nr:TonB-dependent receptor [Thalassotalea sp. LPB0316]QOL24884.1 TonB-dependent receptor [Thalassotalea sp. LPB0316]
MTHFKKSPLFVALAATLILPQAYADDAIDADIETIIVQGDFRQTQLKRSASAVSIVGEQQILERGAQNLEEIIALTPNVNFSSGSQRARYYQIRGIGERSQFSEAINPSVGVIIDGVEFNGIGSVSSLFDVEQTEVFRGPQGTRFGANALAGMINIVTKAPTEDFEGNVKLSAGNYGSYSAGVALSGPASERVNYRFAVEQYNSDGFIENDYLNVQDTNNRDELSVRGKLAIEASDNLSIDLSAMHFDFDNGYDAFSLDNTRQTLSDNPGSDEQKTSAVSAKFNYSGFDHVLFETLLAVANSDLAYGYDEDWSNPTLCQINDCPYGDYASVDYYYRDKATNTAEFRFSSTEGSEIFNGTTQWIGGIYFKNEDEDLTRQYTYLDSDFYSSFNADSIAVFGQFDTQLSKNTVLTTGLRYETRDATYENSDGFYEDLSDSALGGKVVLAHHIDSDQMVYAGVHRGYKAGGANTDGTLPDELRTFDPEYLWNYEVGYKSSLLNGDAYVAATLFFMDRKDVQVKSSQTIVREDGSSEFIDYLGNAAQGTNYGLELEGQWQLSSDLQVFGMLGLLETDFSGFINANGEDLSGREQAHAPNYQFHLGFDYLINQALSFSASVEGKDAFYFSDSHEQKSDAVVLLNASFTYQADDWLVKVWARNLADKDYQTRGFYFGNDPRDGYTPKAYYQYGEPMVFGATFDYQF